MSQMHQSVTDAKRNRRRWIIEQLANKRAPLLAVTILAMAVVMSILFPHSFFSYYNFTNVLLSLSLEGTLAVGMLYLMAAGNFDISIGASIAVGGAVCAYLMKHVAGMPIAFAILAGILSCASAGLIVGLLVAKVGVNALISTIAMMGILRGIAILVAGGGITDLPAPFVRLGQGTLLGIQMPAFYMLAVVAIGALVLAKTRYFRQLYFIGGNIKAAKLSGIKVGRVLIVTFVLMGTISGITGVFVAARLNAAIGTLGNGVELAVITAVVFGGASLSGGRGTVLGAFLGALFMGILRNIMVIAGINVYFQSIIVGIVLLGAVSLDVQLQKQYGRS